MTNKIDRQEITRHFSLLGYQPDDAIYIRFFPSARSDNQKGENWKDIYPEIDFEQLQDFADRGLGAYLVVNGQGHRDADIAAGRAIFCEHDNLSKEEQKVIWRKVGLPEPTFQVDTGGKSIHSYWVFDDFVPASIWRKLQTDLLEFVDGDRKIKNPSRVMRLAGGYHQSGQMTKIVSEPGHRYTYDELRNVIPVSKASVFPEVGTTWHSWVETVKFPIDEVVPLEVCLTRENRNLLETGTFDYRNDNGFALATNLIATANYLSSIGQAYEGNPESMFLDYCRQCPSKDGWDESEWATIWKSAQRGDKHTSLAPDQIENCIKAWLWRKVKPTLEAQQPGQVTPNHPEVDPDEEEEIRQNQRGLLEEFARFKQDRLDLHRIYPAELANAITLQAKSLPIAPECLHQVFMAVASGVLGTRARIMVHKGWYEPCVFFTAFVGHPGTKKSPAMGSIRRPLVELQMLAEREFEAKSEEYQTQKRQWDSKSKDDRANAEPGEVPKEPKKRHYYLEDTTVEAAIEIHAQEESKTGFSILYDELAELYDGMNQYKAGGKGNDRKKILRLWNGGDLKTDRKSGSVFVPKSSVSMCGAVQPETLDNMFDAKDGDGMWGRFLWVDPQYIRADKRSSTYDISAFLLDLYKQLDSFPEDRLFQLSPEAQKLFYQFETWIEDQRAVSSPAMQNALSKMIGYAARIALFLHCIEIAMGEQDDCDRVPRETMRKSLYLCHYYINQVRLIHTRNIKSGITPIMTKVIELSQEIGIVPDRLLVSKRWVETAKEARQVFKDLSDLGLGTTSKTGRVAESWIVQKTFAKHLKTFEDLSGVYNTDEPRVSVSSAEVLQNFKNAPRTNPDNPPTKPTASQKLENHDECNTSARDSESVIEQGLEPPDKHAKDFKTIATTNGFKGFGNQSGKTNGHKKTDDIDLRSYGIDPNEWEEY